MAEAPTDEQRPSRAIGPLGLTFVAVGGVVGSGWLFGPLFAAKLAGPASVLAWVLGGLLVMVAALTFAEVAAMLPVVGGLGRLPQFSHGNVVGMLIGWTAWIGYVTAAPIEVQALLEYASNESALAWLFEAVPVNGERPLSPGGLVVATALLGLFTVVNAFGVKLFASINTKLTWFKIAVPVVAAVALLTRFDSDVVTGGEIAPFGIQGVLAAVSSGGVVFAFLGFRHALDLAGEAERPQRTVPIALIGSLAICIVIFAAVQLGFVGAVSPDQLADGGWAGLRPGGANGPIAAVLAGLGMAVVANLVLADAIVGPFGAGLVASASTARLSVAVSRNGLFPAAIGRLSARGVPLRALVMNTAVGLVILVAFRDGWQSILTFNAGAIVLSFAAGPVTVLALRRQMPRRHRPFRLPAVRLVAAAAFVIVSLLVYWTGWDTMWKLAIPLAVGTALLGWRLRDRRVRRELDLRQAAWLIPYWPGLLALTYVGNFGGGRGWIPFPLDLVAVAAFALAVLPVAVHLRLPDAEALAYVDEDVEDDDDPPDDGAAGAP